jgi:hypothetical protein
MFSSIPIDPVPEDSNDLIDSLFEVSSLPIDPMLAASQLPIDFMLEATNVPTDPMLEAFDILIDPYLDVSNVPIDSTFESSSLSIDPLLEACNPSIDSLFEDSSVPNDPVPEATSVPVGSMSTASHLSIESLFEDPSDKTDPTLEASSLPAHPAPEVQWDFEEKMNFIIALKQGFDIGWIQEVLFYERSVEQLRDLQTKLFDANGKVDEEYLKSKPARKFRPRTIGRIFDRKVRKLPQNVGKEPVWPHTESDRVYAVNKKNDVRPSTKAVPLAPTASKPKPATQSPFTRAPIAPCSTPVPPHMPPPRVPLGNLGGGNVPHLRPTPSSLSARAPSAMDFRPMPVFPPSRASRATGSMPFPPGPPPQAPRPFIPYSEPSTTPSSMRIPSGPSPQAPMPAGPMPTSFVPPPRTPLANLGGGNVPPSTKNKRKRTEAEDDDSYVNKKQKMPKKAKQPRWTDDEEQRLQALINQGRNVDNIHQNNLFPGRSLRGIRTKADNLRKKSLGLPIPGGRRKKVPTGATGQTDATGRMSTVGGLPVPEQNKENVNHAPTVTEEEEENDVYDRFN